MPKSPISVDEKITRQLAELALIELTTDEVQSFSHQVGKILTFSDQLQEVDTQGIEPLYHPFEVATPLRPDVAKPFPLSTAGKPRILDSAPESLYDGFKVPPILGG